MPKQVTQKIQEAKEIKEPQGNPEGQWAMVRRERMAQAVAAGKQLFLSEKIENIKMTQIAQTAGFGVASLYRYFETKEAIAIAVAMELWQDIKNEYVPRLSAQTHTAKSGIDQIRGILDTYSDLLKDHRDFLLFLADFDAFCLKMQIPKDRLSEYEQSIRDFYAPYLKALETGASDGTIRMPADPDLLYLTINHTMLALMQKIAAGDILSQDLKGALELEQMKEIILGYFLQDRH